MSWIAELPSSDQIEYAHWPEPATMRDYADATAEVVDLIGTELPQATVYQAGQIEVPGISDIDLIVVLSSEESVSGLRNWPALAGGLSRRTQLLVRHRPLILNGELWMTLPIVHSRRDYRIVGGGDLPQDLQSGSSVAVSHMLGLIEQKLFSPQRLDKYPLRRSVNVRRALKRLAKFQSYVNALAEFNIHDASWSGFVEAVSDLRQNWYSLGRVEQTQRLYRLICNSAEIDASLMREMSNLLIGMGMEFPANTRGGAEVVGALDFSKVFVQGYDPELRLRSLAGSYQIDGELVSMLPAAFLVPVLLYVSLSSTLARVFQDRLTVFGERPEAGHWPLQPGVAQRIAFLGRYLDFVRARGESGGLFLGTWSFPKRRAGECQRYWGDGPGRLRAGSDLLPFLFRKHVRTAHPRLERFVGRTSTNIYLRLRRSRRKVAPIGSLRDRVFMRVRGALTALWHASRR